MAIVESTNDECTEPLNFQYKRSRISRISSTVLSIIHVYSYYLHLFLSLSLITFIVIRIFWIITEYYYLLQTNLPVSKNFWEIVTYAFHFNVVTWILIVSSIIVIALIWQRPSYTVFFKSLTLPLVLGYVSVLVILHFSQPHDSKFNNLLHIRKSNLLDSGSGMAYSYYHGYLKIIGPSDQGNGITERLRNYENTYNVTIPIKRLFIVIPITSYIPTQLSEGTDGRLIPSNSTEKMEIDRAGVKNRKYQNMVYRIAGPKRWYVCAEGATPVLSLHETLKFEPDLDYLKEEIIFKFYETLHYIINKHEKTRNKFEIVLHNENENLADVLEGRIIEIQNDG